MKRMLSLIATTRTQSKPQKGLYQLRHEWLHNFNLTADELDALFQPYQTIKYICTYFLVLIVSNVTFSRVPFRHKSTCIFLSNLYVHLDLSYSVTLLCVKVRHIITRAISMRQIARIIGMSLPSWSRSIMMSWPIIERPRRSIMSCICTQRFRLGPASRGSRGGIGFRGRICLSRWRNQ